MQEAAIYIMPEIEAPAVTIIRLLDANMHVVKDDLSLAELVVTQAWYDRELLKKPDAQVTVALDRCDDQKIGFSGNTRRRTAYLHVDVWAVDKPEQGVVGRGMREKTCAEVNRIIREKRTKPNETDYDFVGIGQTTGTHKAYEAGSNSEPAPNDLLWSELDNAEYEELWYSDDNRFTKSVNVASQYALMLFRFKIESDDKVVKQIVLKFEGYGTAPSGNGVTIRVWNFTASAWQNAATGTGEADESVAITLVSALTDFIDSNGYVYLLAKTTNPSDGATPVVLHCDYAECSVTVEGVTYCDVVSYRDQDMTNVKPFVWHTEFTVKAWLFENVPQT